MNDESRAKRTNNFPEILLVTQKITFGDCPVRDSLLCYSAHHESHH
jgi:hypothetical protein